ncbi:MAG: type II toxin-antitoxin system VapB family antitoxin [Gemmatimonadaceae bacterium]|nr:type II toxin-antitoxin system VapB family antitoxin [Acetobacteraceae bacterium]
MGAELRIESEEALRLATELAGLHGATVADAVTQALRTALERDRPALMIDEAEIEYKALRAIADDIHRLLRDPLPLSNHDWLYDDVTGLPR